MHPITKILLNTQVSYSFLFQISALSTDTDPDPDPDPSFELSPDPSFELSPDPSSEIDDICCSLLLADVAFSLLASFWFLRK